MTRRFRGAPMPFAPTARLAAVAVVALGCAMGASSANTAAPGSNLQAAGSGRLTPAAAPSSSLQSAAVAGAPSGRLTPSAVLGAVAMPLGSTRLTSRPVGVSDREGPPFILSVPDEQTGFVWWRSSLTQASAEVWFTAHPPMGMAVSLTGQGTPGKLGVPTILGFSSARSSRAAGEPTVYVEVYSLPGGGSAIDLSVDIYYPPIRTAHQMLPAAAKVVAVDRPVLGSREKPQSVTLTDRARIARIINLINALQPVEGIYNCPAHWGGGVSLTFLAADGTVVAKAGIASSGCRGADV